MDPLKLFCRSLVVICFLSGTVFAQTKKISESELNAKFQELEKRQEELEKQQSEIYKRSVEQPSAFKTFLSRSTTFGGYFETLILNMWGPDTRNQLSANSHALGFNLSAEFSDKIHFVSQLVTGLGYTVLNPQGNPAVTPNRRLIGTAVAPVLLTQGYAEYILQPEAVLQIGLGYTPFGYAFQQREPVLFKRRGGPQMLASASINNVNNPQTVGIVFPLWMGLHLSGTLNNVWGYDVYTTNPPTNPRIMGWGTRLWWKPLERLTVGVSQQTGQQQTDPYLSSGGDINLQLETWGFTAEYARNDVRNRASPVSYYFEPYYNLAGGKWVIYLEADYLNNPGYVNGVVADGYEKMQYGGGVNYLPLPYTRLRLGYLNHDYLGGTSVINGVDRDAQTVEFSCGVAF